MILLLVLEAPAKKSPVTGHQLTVPRWLLQPPAVLLPELFVTAFTSPISACLDAFPPWAMVFSDLRRFYPTAN